jgi:ribosomal protein S14
MSGKLFIAKQFNIRERFEKKQIMKIMKNIISSDSLLPLGLYYIKNNQGKKYSKSMFTTRCRISGRAKANFNKFKMSRMIFKKYSENYQLNGLKKASW